MEPEAPWTTEEIISVICTSISGPLPRRVSGEELIEAFRNPLLGDFRKATIVEEVLTKVWTYRVSQLVRSGAISWEEIARAWSMYAIVPCENSRLAFEMCDPNWEMRLAGRS